MKKQVSICIALVLVSALWSIEINAQSSTAATLYNASFFLGWSNTTSGSLPFRIGNSGSPPLLMELKASGDLDITNGANGYQINGNYILRHKGNTGDLFVGVDAGNSTTGSGLNTFVGNEAGKLTTSGMENVFIGQQAGKNNTDGSLNTFVGRCAGRDNIGGGSNTFLGHWACSYNKDCHFNTAVGTYALRWQNYLTSISGETYNTAVGASSLENTNGGVENTAIGVVAGYLNTTGNDNVFVGDSAGYSNGTGLNNTFMGNASDALYDNLTNSTAIGGRAIVTESNNMVLGNNHVNVSIGLSGLSGASAKLHVLRELGATAAIADPTAVKIENSDVDASGTNAYGLTVKTSGANVFNCGGLFNAENASNNTAGSFHATAEANGQNTGAFCRAQNAPVNFGVIGYAPIYSQDFNTFNIGVYGSAPNNTLDIGTIGIGSWAGYFDGDLAYTGGLYALSDSTVKVNVQVLDNAASILSQLNSYSFYFDTTQLGTSVNVSHSKQFGLMAQQVERVAPNLVLNTVLPPVLDTLGHVVSLGKPVKMVDYIGIIPLLVEGYNKLNARIDSLIEALSNAGQKGNGSNGNPQNTQQLTTELSDANAIILDSNSPNPFKEQTKISWNIPAENVELANGFDAKIFFYNKQGTILKTVKIEQTGYGDLIVYANNLSSGSYTYSLVVNGNVIDSKTMVKGR